MITIGEELEDVLLSMKESNLDSGYLVYPFDLDSQAEDGLVLVNVYRISPLEPGKFFPEVEPLNPFPVRVSVEVH